MDHCKDPTEKGQLTPEHSVPAKTFKSLLGPEQMKMAEGIANVVSDAAAAGVNTCNAASASTSTAGSPASGLKKKGSKDAGMEAALSLFKKSKKISA